VKAGELEFAGEIDKPDGGGTLEDGLDAFLTEEPLRYPCQNKVAKDAWPTSDGTCI